MQKVYVIRFTKDMQGIKPFKSSIFDRQRDSWKKDTEMYEITMQDLKHGETYYNKDLKFISHKIIS